MSESTGRPGTPEEFNAALSRVQVLEGKKSAAALGLVLEALAHPDEPCRQWGERQVRAAKGNLGADEPQASLRLLSDAIFGEDRALAVAAARQLWPLRTKLKAPEKLAALEIAVRTWKESPEEVAVGALEGVADWRSRVKAKQAPPGFLEAFVALVERGLDKHGQLWAADALQRLKDAERRNGRVTARAVQLLLDSDHEEVRKRVLSLGSWELVGIWSQALIAAHDKRDLPDAAGVLIQVTHNLKPEARARALGYPIPTGDPQSYCYYLFRACAGQRAPVDLTEKCVEALLHDREVVRNVALSACGAFFESSWSWEPAPFGRLVQTTLERVTAGSLVGAVALAQALSLEGTLWRYGVELQQQLKAALADASTEVGAQVAAALAAAVERLQASGHGEEAARLLEAWRPLVAGKLVGTAIHAGLFGRVQGPTAPSPLQGVRVTWRLDEREAEALFDADRLRWSVGEERGQAPYRAASLDSQRVLVWVDAQPGFALVLDLTPDAPRLSSAGLLGTEQVLDTLPLDRVERP